MTTHDATLATLDAHPSDRHSIGALNLLRSEWVKLRSVRSTYLTAAVAVLATVALAAVTCWRYDWLLAHGQDGGGFEPTALSLNGTYLAQLAAGVLGVVTISSEYGTGMLRASLCAVPQRGAFLTAKGAVFAGVTFVVGAALSFAAFGLGESILAGQHAGSSLTQPGVLRAVIGAALYLTVVGMLGFGLGAAIRHTAGALTALFALLFVPTGIVQILPTNWHHAVEKYLPVNAGSQVFTVPHNPRFFGPWAGLGVFSLYALLAVTVAAVLIQRRDA